MGQDISKFVVRLGVRSRPACSLIQATHHGGPRDLLQELIDGIELCWAVRTCDSRLRQQTTGAAPRGSRLGVREMSRTQSESRLGDSAKGEADRKN